jgi:predicted glycosyltransferase
MNREAAVLGVPVWSVFTGPMPRIDERLAEEGRLRWIRAPEDVLAALAEPMPQHRSPRGPFPGGLTAILEDVDRVLS